MLNIGTSVGIVDKFEDGWWNVIVLDDNNQHTDIKGLYPSNYLQILESPSNSGDCKMLFKNDKNNNNNLTTKTETKNELNSSSLTDKSLTSDNSMLSPRLNTDNDTFNINKLSISSGEKEIEYYRVIYPFKPLTILGETPNQSENFDINVNDVVKLLEDEFEYMDAESKDQMLKVFTSCGEIGFIPANIVQPIVDPNFLFLRHPAKRGLFAGFNWYFGNITRIETNNLLNKYASNGDYLVRDSERDIGQFTISLKSEQLGNKHFKVIHKDNKFIIGKKNFTKMTDLLEHYYKNAIYDDQRGNLLYLCEVFQPPTN
jgi:hypothetical protein